MQNLDFPSADSRRIHRSSLQPILILTGLGAFLYIIAAITLIQIARQQNQHALEYSRLLVDAAISSQLKESSTLVAEYAFWGEAYENLHLNQNTRWAYEQRNLGPSLYEDLQYEAIFVIGPDNRATYSMEYGKITDAEPSIWLTPASERLIQELQKQTTHDRRGDVVTGLDRVNGQLALFSAAPITPDRPAKTSSTSGPQSILVFIYIFTQEKLTDLGSNYKITNLQFLNKDIQTEKTLHKVESISGGKLFFTWVLPTPGTELLKSISPIITILAIVSGFLVALVFINTAKTARQLTNSQAELSASRARFQDVAEATSDWIWETDSDLIIKYLSNKFTEATGYQCSYWIGRKITELFLRLPDRLSPPQKTPIPSHQDGIWRCEYCRPNNVRRTCLISWRKIQTGQNSGGYRGTSRDITEEENIQKKLEHFSLHDQLTGVANRRKLHQYLDEILPIENHENNKLAILAIDLDGFKPINDTYGHDAGDKVLNEVAIRLQTSVRDTDLIARIGGDEFIIVIMSTTAKKELSALCKRILHTLEKPYKYHAHSPSLSASIGVAFAPQDSNDRAELMQLADIALYQAKREGKRTWRFFNRAPD